MKVPPLIINRPATLALDVNIGLAHDPKMGRAITAASPRAPVERIGSALEHPCRWAITGSARPVKRSRVDGALKVLNPTARHDAQAVSLAQLIHFSTSQADTVIARAYGLANLSPG